MGEKGVWFSIPNVFNDEDDAKRWVEHQRREWLTEFNIDHPNGDRKREPWDYWEEFSYTTLLDVEGV